MIEKIKEKISEKIMNSTITRKQVYIFLALMISLALVAPSNLTWARDRVTYINFYALGSSNVLQWRIQEGFLAVLSNEPLFLIMNIFLAIFLSPEAIVRTIIFLGSFISLIAFGKIAKYNLWMLFFFLFIPNIILKYTAQIRQGLAIGIYTIGLTGLMNKKKWSFLRFISVFIHTSLMFNILLEYMEKFFEKLKLSMRVRAISSFILFLFMPMMIPTILYITNDRRLDEYTFSGYEGASGLGFILWLGIGILYFILSKRNTISNICFYGIIMYLTFYFTLDIGPRIFENIIPIFMATLLADEQKRNRILYIILFFLIGILMWIMGAGYNIISPY